tara:strand:+ start:678 stop:1130 length:453 start_codon:yes stop_codon:yes gene_type:complete
MEKIIKLNLNYCLLTICSILLLSNVFAKQENLKVFNQNNYSFINAGNTNEEIEKLKKLVPKYAIQLIFKEGGKSEKVKGIEIKIYDKSGDLVIQYLTIAPFMFIKPPSGLRRGRYKIEAKFKDEIITKTKDLLGRRNLVLVFDFKKHNSR